MSRLILADECGLIRDKFDLTAHGGSIEQLFNDLITERDKARQEAINLHGQVEFEHAKRNVAEYNWSLLKRENN